MARQDVFCRDLSPGSDSRPGRAGFALVCFTPNRLNHKKRRLCQASF